MLLSAHALFRPLRECVALAQELSLFCLVDKKNKKKKTFVARLDFFEQLYQTDFVRRYLNDCSDIFILQQGRPP